MDILTVVKRFIGKDRSGQITLKLQGHEHLLKIYIQGGRVVYAAMGRQKGREILEHLKDANVVESSFIEGISPPHASDEDLTEAFLSMMPASAETEPAVEVQAEEVSAQKIKELEEEFVEIVGPIGTVLIEDIYRELAYDRGKPMNGTEFSILLSRLLQEVPPERREEFKKRFS